MITFFIITNTEFKFGLLISYDLSKKEIKRLEFLKM